MKKFLIIIFILLVGVGLYYYKHSKPGILTPGTVTNDQFKPDPSSATFTFDDGPVTLTKGRNVTPEENGASSETLLLQERATGDINNDSKDDTVLLMTQSGGASGVFIYIAAYVSGPVSYKGTNALFVGDRISPQSIDIKNGLITFKYLDRKPDEPFAAEPTVPTTKQYTFRNGSIEEK